MDFKNYEKRLEDIRIWLQKEFSGIRTGIASVSVLDGVKVSAYGSLMPLDQLASILVEGAKSLFVSPFDKSVIKDIEKAITDANLGLSAAASSDGIRLSFPDLTADRRTMLLKLAKEKTEDARVSIRKNRDEVWKEIQQKEKDGEISEDEKFRLKEKMEALTKEFNTTIDKMYDTKEVEINE